MATMTGMGNTALLVMDVQNGVVERYLRSAERKSSPGIARVGSMLIVKCSYGHDDRHGKHGAAGHGRAKRRGRAISAGQRPSTVAGDARPGHFGRTGRRRGGHLC